ncbi:SURF1 family cytochrome oxidase biogenesis protein [Corynebacterium ammoniagenes]|uniref:SURF1-like protein n=1 Tax=Corynebacterium ammoniagenes TaxID=1697 RepID=A0AAV5G972_CORAM|nr:SURF1 family protein [Corynebacterium ammoniagenes]GJN42061.1 SURF1-like protein [Corynebacterium ammoniagenes]
MREQVKKKKSRWTSVLRPSWILLILFVIAFTYVSITVLSPWQLNKDDDIVERNHQLEAAFEEDPIPYQDVFDNGSLDADEEWKRVTLSGHYLNEDETLLRMRPVTSGPSYQSLVPFETTQGDVILINRGWIEAGPANAVPEDLESAPSGQVDLNGFARLGEAVHPNPPIERDGYKQVYSINAETITDVTGVEDLSTGFVQLSDDQPGGLNTIPLPSMDRGNHLSYGYQWIAFGILAPIGLGWFIYSEIRERRRAEKEQAELEALGTTDKDDNADAAGATEATESTESTDAPADNATATVASSPAEPEQSEEPVVTNTTTVASRRRRARYGDAHPDHYAKFNKRSQDRA